MANREQFEYNRKSKKQLKNMIKQIKIIDNFHEHKGYKKNTILDVLYINNDGFMITKNYCCSFSEIEIIN
jgi:hypothetical protein